MFQDVFENLRKASDSTIQTQQELFKKWASLWPGVPASPTAWGGPVQKLQKPWVEIVNDLVKKQREVLETHFNAGLRNIEEASPLVEVKNPEELRTKTIELWQKSFDCLRQTYEAQLHELQTAVSRWAALMTKGTTP